MFLCLVNIVYQQCTLCRQPSDSSETYWNTAINSCIDWPKECFQKTANMNSEKIDATDRMEMAHRIVQRTKKFIYLCEIINHNDNEKQALRKTTRKMQMTFKHCCGIYKSKYISFTAKLKCYCTVVRLSCLYITTYGLCSYCGDTN